MVGRWLRRLRLAWALRRIYRDAARARRDPDYDGPAF